MSGCQLADPGGEGQPPATMFGFLRRHRETEVEGTACQWCRTVIPATTGEALFLAGAVLDPLAGWFCSNFCARQYGLNFKVKPALPASQRPGNRTR